MRNKIHERLLGRFKMRARGQKYVDRLRPFIATEFVPDWSDLRQRSIGANVALTLGDSDGDAAVRKAFATADLDPVNPLNWRTLLEMFAEIHFGRRLPGPGRRRKWNSENLCRLIEDHAYMKAKHPKKNDTYLCKQICAEFPNRYPSKDVQTLRRNLSNARDLNKNDRLKLLQDTIARKMRMDCLNRNVEQLAQKDLLAAAHEKALELIANGYFARK